jgi:DNA-binding PadR family transcriptional regulator
MGKHHAFWQHFGHHHDHHDHHHGHHGGPPETFFGGGRGRRGGGREGRGEGGGRGGGWDGPFGGGRFGGGFPWANDFPFFRRGGRARRGDVRAAILVLLAEQPRNGYQLMQEIEQRSEGSWRPSPGSMYPALQQLEDEGLVRVETDGGGGRVYHLTDAGREQARARQKEPAPWDAAAGGTPEAAGDLRQIVKQVMLAAMQVAQAGNAAQLAEARRILADTRRALYRLLAEDGASDTGGEEG